MHEAILGIAAMMKWNDDRLQAALHLARRV